MTIYCDNCSNEAKGEITYDDGTIVVGCADCLLKEVNNPEVFSIHEYTSEDLEEKETEKLIISLEK